MQGSNDPSKEQRVLHLVQQMCSDISGYYFSVTKELVLPDEKTFSEEQEELLSEETNNLEFLDEVKRFQSGKYDETEYKHLRGMTRLVINNVTRFIPIFTAYAERLLPCDFLVDKLDEGPYPFAILINNKSPYQQQDGSSSGMSSPHMLLIPRARIYNASTLLGPDIVNMLQFFEVEIKRIFDDTAFRQMVKARNRKVVEDKLESLTPEEKTEVLALLKHHEYIIDNADSSELDVRIHSHKYHTVGHLHLHILLKSCKTNHNYWKNSTPLSDVTNACLRRGMKSLSANFMTYLNGDFQGSKYDNKEGTTYTMESKKAIKLVH